MEPIDVLCPRLCQCLPYFVFHTNIFLQKGATSVKFEGSTDGKNAQIGQALQTPIPITGDFSKSLALSPGLNPTSVYSEKESNAVIDSYDPISPGTKRLSGKSPNQIANTTSREIDRFFDTSTVYLTGDNAWVHGISATPLIAQDKSPFLLTNRDTLTASTKEEIQRLNPDKVIIIGGPGTVSEEVEAQLSNLNVSVERIWGPTRYDSPPKIAERLIDPVSNPATSAFIVTGENSEDAMSIASIAGQLELPILLVKSTSVPDSVKAFLEDHPEITSLYVSGKRNAISNEVINTLHSYGQVVDIRGTNRYEANVNALWHFRLNPSSLTLANAWTIQEMLTAAPLSVLTESPLLLTNGNVLPEFTMYYLEDQQENLDYMYVIGDPASISDAIEKKLYQLIP